MKFLKTVPGETFCTSFGQTEAMGVSVGRAAERPGNAWNHKVLAQVKLFDDYDNEVPGGKISIPTRRKKPY
ncbi:MAG: hypothetical protein HN745_13145 [Deltaproteobacteria bacterium]|nr:hypothetical protein [Deltaproteobacteria bacterium]